MPKFKRGIATYFPGSEKPLKEFASSVEAADFIVQSGIRETASPSTIRKAAAGHTPTAYGMVWKYTNEGKREYGSAKGDDGRLYKIWSNMKSRCNNPKDVSYPHIGAKGVKVCAEWESYEAFRDWSMENGYGDGLFLYRIDTDGDFSPSNCVYREASADRGYIMQGSRFPVSRSDGLGNVVLYDSLTEAAQDLLDNGEGCISGDLMHTMSNISLNCRGKTATAYGYVFSYID